MAKLKIFQEQELKQTCVEAQEIEAELEKIKIGFEQWGTKKLDDNSSEAEIAQAYQEEINKTLKENSFSNFDIVSVNPDLAGIEKLKEKFLPEHTHDDNEVRFFIEGSGLFCVNQNEKVYEILCEEGDYISVPANTKHWFDMGSQAKFKCIRFFEDEAGWVAKYTGSQIASEHPGFDEF